ncbi:triose-phosphate isomerase [Mycoplasma struthionis]|uniref:Triosephosphate isomerase n=1 Tax=Mycoplasma struthionis TaxID=538220 RepID=A0A3G8LHE1_9MOLU|nr:triose-phosphate isomerase family protein [Mycoplasma struthionis]AZG68764.1 triosephosphate isomerase [Mycoplasma struthionis]
MKYLLGNLKMNLSYFDSLNYLNTLNSKINDSNLNNLKLGIALSHDAMSLSLAFKNRDFLLGAQNIFHTEKGAFTGEVSFRSAVELNMDFVLIGHSERRMMFNETDELINQKIKRIENTDIIPVLCIGENKEQFEAKKMPEVIENQIKSALKDIDILGRLIISYEPIYCIGNGIIPEICHIQKAIDLIAKLTNNQVPILYGGSVSLKNIHELKEVKNLSGFLVGGAAIDAEKFLELAKEVNK